MKTIKTIGNIAFYVTCIIGVITFVGYSMEAGIPPDSPQLFSKDIVGMMKGIGTMGIGFFIKVLVDQI